MVLAHFPSEWGKVVDDHCVSWGSGTVFFLFFRGRGILKGRSFSKQRSSTCLFKPNNDELESSILNDRGSHSMTLFLIRHGEFSSCWLESLVKVKSINRWRNFHLSIAGEDFDDLFIYKKA